MSSCAGRLTRYLRQAGEPPDNIGRYSLRELLLVILFSLRPFCVATGDDDR
jgi:hypothetical protein